VKISERYRTQSLGPIAALKLPRKKPSEVLPSERISFSRHLEVLRVFAQVSGRKNLPVSNEAIASAVGMKATTLSLLNPFFLNVGFLRKDGLGYKPSSEVLRFAQRYSTGDQAAGSALAPLLTKTWFARVLLPHLAYGSIEKKAAILILAESALTPPDDRITLLVDYLTTSGVVELVAGRLRHGKFAIQSEPNSADVLVDFESRDVRSRPSAGRMDFSVRFVCGDDLLTWDVTRQSELFNALGQLLRVSKGGQSPRERSVWLTEAEAAERLNVSTRTLRRLALREKLRRRSRPVSGRRPATIYYPPEIDALEKKRRPVEGENSGQDLFREGRSARRHVRDRRPAIRR
jgi:hypothetical protein